jgi:FRG domain-containing protein
MGTKEPEDLDSAEDFMRALSSTHGVWSEHPTAWVFRGQADAGWKLVAKAIREPTLFGTFGIPGDACEWSARKHMLDVLLDRFRQWLDRSGIEAPHEAPVDWRRQEQMQSGEEPDQRLFPLMALAQHLGLPTLFLDWTRRAHVAAYFAAYFALHDEKKASRLVVWALRGGHDAIVTKRKLRFYQAPAASNQNLRAQAGLFIRVSPERAPEADRYVVRSLDEVVAGMPDETATLERVTLPTTLAPKLLRLLSYEGVHGASMFPQADGVVRAMQEAALFDKPNLASLDE